ncbi:hypothetical protein [Verrucomicrobium spinosum]|uniref:hypothetical protein n=1 Tax=Verrucomicrobium spinosum TaxID=2736 RepID=UPI0009463EC5|nr:hypothetical protein [Verrucomicrobium spinosum]
MIRDFNWYKHLSRGCGVIAAFCMALPSAHGDTIIKADNADALNLGTSWSGGLVPGTNDVAQWDSSVTGVNTVNLGADAGWRGLSVLNPGGAVEISGANTLTLGASGIDMSSAAVDLTLSSGLSLLGNTQQSWKVAAGRTLNLHTGVFTRNTGAVLNVQGDGTVSTTNILNGATGIIGAWATIGTGASTRYATVNSGNIIAYTGTAAATAANVTSTAGTENYELAAAGAFGAGASFNTLRYTGATGTVTNPTTTNGIMNVGGGTLTMANTVNVGSTNELVSIRPTAMSR